MKDTGSKVLKSHFCTCFVNKHYPKYPTRVFSGIEVGFGRVRVYPTFEMSGSGMSGIGKSRGRAGIFGFEYTRTHH